MINPELQLNKAPFLDIHLILCHQKFTISLTTLILMFPCLDGDVPRRTSLYRVYISQIIRFARVCSHVKNFNARNKMFNSQTSPTVLPVS